MQFTSRHMPAPKHAVADQEWLRTSPSTLARAPEAMRSSGGCGRRQDTTSQSLSAATSYLRMQTDPTAPSIVGQTSKSSAQAYAQPLDLDCCTGIASKRNKEDFEQLNSYHHSRMDKTSCNSPGGSSHKACHQMTRLKVHISIPALGCLSRASAARLLFALLRIE